MVLERPPSDQPLSGDEAPEDFRALGVRAVAEEQAGNLREAADFYRRAGNIHAIMLYEQLNDYGTAYRVAVELGADADANRLAAVHGIPHHEFTNVMPPIPGKSSIERMAIALASRLRVDATAERLGFRGFQGATVFDVGTRDGRYIPMLRELGARDVYGIDPDVVELERAMATGILDRAHAIPTTIERIPEALRGQADVVVAFNYNAGITDLEPFIAATAHALKPHGQALFTFAEEEVYQQMRPVLSRHFIFDGQELWIPLRAPHDVRISDRTRESKCGNPHRFLVVATKR